MANLINQGFLTGYIIARDLPREEALRVAIATSQTKPGNLIPAIALKSLIDRQVELERELDEAQAALAQRSGRTAAGSGAAPSTSKSIRTARLDGQPANTSEVIEEIGRSRAELEAERDRLGKLQRQNADALADLKQRENHARAMKQYEDELTIRRKQQEIEQLSRKSGNDGGSANADRQHGAGAQGAGGDGKNAGAPKGRKEDPQEVRGEGD